MKVSALPGGGAGGGTTHTPIITPTLPLPQGLSRVRGEWGTHHSEYSGLCPHLLVQKGIPLHQALDPKESRAGDCHQGTDYATGKGQRGDITLSFLVTWALVRTNIFLTNQSFG